MENTVRAPAGTWWGRSTEDTSVERRLGILTANVPLSSCTTEFLVDSGVPSMHATAPVRSGARVQLHFLHFLCWPS
jgi:hypothetical protein